MRFKMYKNGKYWAIGAATIAGIFGAVMLQSNGVRASASDVSTVNNSQTVIGIQKSDQGLVDYSDTNGTKVVNNWATQENKTYYFGADGLAVTGLQTINQQQYYFNADQTLLVNNSVTVDGQVYQADSKGVLTKQVTSSDATSTKSDATDAKSTNTDSQAANATQSNNAGSTSTDANAVADAYKNGTDTGASKLPAQVGKVNTVTSDTIKGVDLTSYQAEKSAGVTYYDFNGQKVDDTQLMNLLKANGVNYISLKVAVDPFDAQGHPYGEGVPSLQNAMKTAAIAKAAGLKVNITFLYSDAQTYDTTQKAPKNWPTDTDALNKKVQDYTTDSLSQLKAAGVTPDMVTLGNQINWLFMDKTDMPTIAGLLKTAADAVKSQDPSAEVAIGLGKPNQWWSSVLWQLDQSNVNYDVISANINPAWNSLDDIKAAKAAVLAVHKKFTVGSVTYPFTDQDSDGKVNDSLASDILANKTGTISPQGQATYLQQLFSLVTSDGNNNGVGVAYGDATWIAVKPGNSAGWAANNEAANQYGTGWASKYAAGYISGADQYWGGNTQDNQALFDDQGKPLQSLTVFKQISDDNNQQTTPTVDPNAAKQDPYEFGGDTGLKEQNVNITKIDSMTNQAIRGVDISSYQSLKDAGVKFYDYNGNEVSLLKILHDEGVNYIRLRVWNDPKNAQGQGYGGGDNDADQDLKIAQEASQYGMKVLLDFHYSDFWADPAQQILPKAWAGHSQEQLVQDVYDYTSQTIKKFQDAGVNVGMVQIGNEITNGMMGQTTNRDAGGSYTGAWLDPEKSQKIVAYLNSASKAVRDSDPNALITIQLETPDLTKYNNIMSVLKAGNVDYDVLGSSYYPYWSVTAKSNTPETLASVQKMAMDKYGKLFAVMETAWVNSLKNADSTPNSIGEDQSDWQNTNAFPVGPQGQVDELTQLYQTVMSQANGLGAFYWEPAWIPTVAGWRYGDQDKANAEKYGTGWASSAAVGYFPDSKMYWQGKPAWGGSSWDNQGLFDIEGHPLQSLKFYKDAGNSNQEQLTRINFVDSDNTIIKTIYSKNLVGQNINISYPDLPGYAATDGSTAYTAEANVDGIKTVNIKVDRIYKEVSDGNKWHLVNTKTGQNQTGFQRLYDGRNVYYDQNGDMQYGQQNIDGKWYLFDKNTGAMQYGRQYIADQNKWVLYDRNDGTMQYGQQFDQNHWYLFDTMTGAMQYGRQYIADQNKWALYDRNDGTMQYGQQYDQGHWYLFDTMTGAMQYGRQYIADQKKWVLYDRNDGTMQYGQQFDQGRWYLFDTITGAMQYGRQYIADQKKWVLYDRNDGTMQYGQQSDQGHWYLFDTITGAMQYGRQYIADQKKWVLYDRNDGTMQYGEKQDQGNWYLFDTVTGAMQYGEHYLDGSKKWANYNEMTGILD
ncbi:glycosyl hydrolase 53 family protein [Fructobacillus tropaeoli]|uniref:glycosyl hydrolase 53 family protein n=1 Tax=Fructobacillus tropaeoli TaxID=709323 RepID=UPI002D882B7D|nr:4-beta-galactosidase (GanB) [Fructobacillus tropaeoli]